MQRDQEIYIDKLFIFDRAYSTTLSDVVIAQPAVMERSHQRLIILVDFPKSAHGLQQMSDGLVKQALKLFDSSKHLAPELVLESILESLNILLPQIAQKKNKSWMENLGVLIAVSDRGQIHFSQIGNMYALLIQQSSIEIVSEHMETVNPLKMFPHITSGSLDHGNAMLLTTGSLLDYVSNDKVRKILFNNPPDIAIQHIENLLSQVPSSVSFAATIIKFTTDLDTLASKDHAAQMTTSDTFKQSIKPTQAPDQTVTSSERTKRRMSRPREYRSFDPVSWFKAALVSSIKSGAFFFLIVYNTVRIALIMIARTLHALFVPRMRSRYEEQFTQTSINGIDRFKQKYSLLPRRSKISLFLLLILIFTLLHILIIRNQEQLEKDSISTYNQTLLTVSERKQAVTNAIIYNDEKRAEKLLIEIDMLLKNITPQDKTQEAQLAQYIQENEESLNKIRHINYIAEPFIFADLTALTETPRSLIFNDDGSVTLLTELSVFNVSSDNQEKLSTSDEQLLNIFRSDDVVFIMTNDNGLFRLSNSQLIETQLPLHESNREISALELYSNNFYILDRNAGNIFKYEGNGRSFKAGSVWSENADLFQDSSDLTVDGNIYVLGNDGGIVKLLRGEREPFSYHALNPKLGTGARIYTTKESDLLYILDPVNKRIVILDKEGNIKDQFTSPRFDDLRAFSVNPQEDTLVVLSNKVIYALAIKK